MMDDDGYDLIAADGRNEEEKRTTGRMEWDNSPFPEVSDASWGCT
jgi:hypothetical protein